jgi:hypothetical protein
MSYAVVACPVDPSALVIRVTYSCSVPGLSSPLVGDYIERFLVLPHLGCTCDFPLVFVSNYAHTNVCVDNSHGDDTQAPASVT